MLDSLALNVRPGCNYSNVRYLATVVVGGADEMGPLVRWRLLALLVRWHLPKTRCPLELQLLLQC